jgi:hypothetical protein
MSVTWWFSLWKSGPNRSVTQPPCVLPSVSASCCVCVSLHTVFNTALRRVVFLRSLWCFRIAFSHACAQDCAATRRLWVCCRISDLRRLPCVVEKQAGVIDLSTTAPESGCVVGATEEDLPRMNLCTRPVAFQAMLCRQPMMLSFPQARQQVYCRTLRCAAHQISALRGICPPESRCRVGPNLPLCCVCGSGVGRRTQRPMLFLGV